jgi:filamentous hemagglutinin
MRAAAKLGRPILTSQGTANAASGAQLQAELAARAGAQADTSRDAHYITQTDPRVALDNKFDWDHVLSGEINPAGKATGYHAETAAAGAARITPGAAVKQNANGTYEAPVQIWDQTSGQWVDKVRQSTFFPADWSQARIEYEVSEAFKVRVSNSSGPGTIGTSPSGI